MRDSRPLELPIITRRKFIHGAVTVGAVGGLALSVDLPAQERAGWRGGAARAPRDPAAFLQIGEDGVITIISPAVEMGQGGHTSLPMIIVEELGGRWEQVRVMDAAAAPIYDNPMFGQQSTVGSFSVRGWYTELRRIGAAARMMLVAAAARRWRVPERECTAADSEIVHARSGRRCSFGSVARVAARMRVPQQPELKQTSAFRLIGTSPERVDIRDKVDGSARYGIDVVLPDMLYAAIRTCPTLGGRLKSFDDSDCRGVAGFEKAVPLPDGVIVVARSYWQARKALERLRTDFDPGPLAALTSEKVSARLRAGFDEPGTVARHDGDAEAALARAAKRLEAVYEVPYLAHACMEPMNCTARVTDEGCEVWCGTQSPQAAQSGAAQVLGIPSSRVKVNVQYLGGGFGRRGQADFVTQAVTAARATGGKPVKLIWSREEDIQHDWYRPAAAVRFRGGLDAAGRLVALDCKVVTASAPSFGRPGGPPFYTEGISDATYRIPNFRVTGVDQNLGVRFGFWRSVNDSHNPFMLEGFIDELARAAQQDPYLFRRAMLQDDRPAARRQLALTDLLAAKAGWHARPPGHAFGIASLGAFGSFVGAVAEVSLEDQIVTLHRVLLGIDCGLAVHPDNIAAQCEGGMVFGLTAALRGEITLANGAVTQSNFNDYPMLQLLEMPRVECYIVPSTAAPGGVGEPSTATIAPALANAIYAASDLRLRSLPLTRHQLGFRAMRT
ncbi:MAG: molybdopterin cofactor-binding domain-containing protein [Steroidobacteraceae bacterium]